MRNYFGNTTTENFYIGFVANITHRNLFNKISFFTTSAFSWKIICQHKLSFYMQLIEIYREDLDSNDPENFIQLCSSYVSCDYVQYITFIPMLLYTHEHYIQNAQPAPFSEGQYKIENHLILSIFNASWSMSLWNVGIYTRFPAFVLDCFEWIRCIIDPKASKYNTQGKKYLQIHAHLHIYTEEKHFEILGFEQHPMFVLKLIEKTLRLFVIYIRLYIPTMHFIHSELFDRKKIKCESLCENIFNWVVTPYSARVVSIRSIEYCGRSLTFHLLSFYHFFI